MTTLVLLDGDIITFRAAFSAEDDNAAIACARADKMIDDILVELGASEYEVWLTGKNNFRYKVYPEYKANRVGKPRPKWEQEVKQHLIDLWQANVSDGCEADDMLGARACMYQEMSEANIPIIATIDKDLDTIPGEHYNFVKKQQYFITNEEAIRNFYYQCLVGDAADNIKGASGIGPVKAKKIVASGVTLKDVHAAVLDCFSCEEEFELNAKCVWIWHKLDDIYSLETHGRMD